MVIQLDSTEEQLLLYFFLSFFAPIKSATESWSQKRERARPTATTSRSLCYKDPATIAASASKLRSLSVVVRSFHGFVGRWVGRSVGRSPGQWSWSPRCTSFGNSRRPSVRMWDQGRRRSGPSSGRTAGHRPMVVMGVQ